MSSSCFIHLWPNNWALFYLWEFYLRDHITKRIVLAHSILLTSLKRRNWTNEILNIPTSLFQMPHNVLPMCCHWIKHSCWLYPKHSDKIQCYSFLILREWQSPLTRLKEQFKALQWGHLVKYPIEACISQEISLQLLLWTDSK